jgi:biopolymer transport protein ExbD
MGMNVGGSGKKGQPTPDVNVTPLVDVTLVVLIIFMVMTPLMTKTFWLNLPDKPEERAEKPKPQEKVEPLVMTVDSEGTIRVNKTVLQKEECWRGKVRRSSTLMLTTTFLTERPPRRWISPEPRVLAQSPS